jgi:hypothetical protein
MSSHLCLERSYAGVVTRIEGLARPLHERGGAWYLLLAAGLSGAQPSVVHSQGPIYGGCEAEQGLRSIAEALQDMGYVASAAPLGWRLHLQAELRRLAGGGGAGTEQRFSRPDG